MNLRLPPDLETRIRQEAGRLQQANPATRTTAADVVRAILSRELPPLLAPGPRATAKGGRHAAP